MRRSRVITGVVLVAAGALWTLQGLGVLPGSPMSGVTFWAVLGPVVALVGVALLLTARRQDGPRR